MHSLLCYGKFELDLGRHVGKKADRLPVRMTSRPSSALRFVLRA